MTFAQQNSRYIFKFSRQLSVKNNNDKKQQEYTKTVVLLQDNGVFLKMEQNFHRILHFSEFDKTRKHDLGSI